jgi:hypothetical protein
MKPRKLLPQVISQEKRPILQHYKTESLNRDDPHSHQYQEKRTTTSLLNTLNINKDNEI